MGLILKGIKKRFSSGFCLDINDLVFPKGEVSVIMGGNGSGKTTLLNVAAYLDEPDEGEVVLETEEALLTDSLLEKRRRIGYVMQELFLFWSRYIFEWRYLLKFLLN